MWRAESHAVFIWELSSVSAWSHIHAVSGKTLQPTVVSCFDCVIEKCVELCKRKARNKGSNLQTSSSACPYCYGLVCPQLQSQGCSPSPCPGGHLRRRSCGDRQLAPWSEKRATGSEGGPRSTHHALALLHPPCHPPNATTPLVKLVGRTKRTNDGIRVPSGRKQEEKKGWAQAEIY